jgi:hypothetical protein
MPDLSKLSKREPLAVGVAGFGAIMLMVAGLAQALMGFAAVLNQIALVSSPRYLYAFDTTAWGWIHLLLGVGHVAVGLFILSGRTWAIWTGVALAGLNAVANFAWLPLYPVGAVVLIGIDVLVVWALVTVARPPRRSRS